MSLQVESGVIDKGEKKKGKMCNVGEAPGTSLGTPVLGRSFHAGVLRQVGAKLCSTLALQDRVWIVLFY